MTNASRLYLSPPHMCGRELDFVQAAFRSNWVAPAGPDIDAFQQEICDYTGAPHAVAVTSGTAALHLALLALHVTEGDEVICSTFTFAGGAFPIAYQGATPVFVDSSGSSTLAHKIAQIPRARIGSGTAPSAARIGTGGSST